MIERKYSKLRVVFEKLNIFFSRYSYKMIGVTRTDKEVMRKMRQRKILEALQDEKLFFSANNLAALLHVSSRTIINDIKCLNYEGKRNGFSILLKRGQGYYLKINDKALYDQYYNDNVCEDVFVDSKHRIEDITVVLLLENDYITYEELADIFQISKLTVKRDMAEVRKVLEENCAVLDSKAHYGIRVIARSYHRRVLLTKLYERGNRLILNRCNKTVGDEFQEVEKTLLKLLKEYDLATNYTELHLLDTFLKVLICTHVRELFEDEAWEHGDDQYYEIAQELSSQIQNLYHIELYPSELDDFAVYLKQHTQGIKVKEKDQNNDISCFVKKCLMQLHEEFDLDFFEDEQFIKNLTSHIIMLLDRLHQNITFRNPLIDTICVKYPVTVDISIRFAKLLEDQYHVKMHQDEIGFIATHFAVYMERISQKQIHLYKRIAVVCSSGGGSAFLIKLKLETLFADSIIQSFSLLEMEELRKFKPDVIFTISDLMDDLDVPVIKINELMDDDEMMRIHHLLRNDLTENDLFSVLHKEAFRIVEKPVSYEQLLTEMAMQIEEEGYAEKGYCKYVLQREQFMSTIYANGVAIPHPINMCGTKNLVSVAIVKNEVKDAIKPLKLVFMVSLRKENLKLHEQITMTLLDIMQDEKTVNELVNSTSYEDFIRRANISRGGN